MNQHQRAIFLAAMQGGGAAPATYSISGTVYDADGTTAVSGATVAIGAASTTSAANGTYSITGLAAGTSGSLTCTKTGYSWTAVTIAAMSGNVTQNFVNAWWAGAGCSGNCQGAYQGIAAASQSASYVNLKSPGTHDLTTSAAPSWATESGWTFNGSTFLDTGITPPDTQAWSQVVQYQGAAQETKVICGSLVHFDGGEFAIYPRRIDGVRYVSGATSTGTLIVSPGLATGNLIMAGTHPYRNGVSDGTIPTSTPGDTLGSVYIGGANHNTVGLALGCTAKVQCYALYNAILSPTQAAMIYNGIQAQGFFLAP
jgi:hypothetical protein